MTATDKRSRAIRFIVCLGIVSMFADITYEGARSVIGPFLNTLGASATQVGLIAGIGEMAAASLRLFSGRIADRTRAYWTITICGYGVNLIAVPALAFAGNWWTAAILVALERTGKSIRGPARDVLLSEATATVGHGWGFGLHAALDQTGAVIGPLIVAYTVAKSHSFGPAFIGLALPAAAALVSLLIARALFPAQGAAAPHQVEQTHFPRIFWIYVASAGILACGFVDFALLSYHLQKTAVMGPAMIPLVYSGAMAVNAITAPLFGRLFDRFGVVVLSIGTLISMLSLPLGFLGGPTAVMAGVACWATGMGAQDAVLRSGIAQVVSMNKRGSAFGAFNGVFGVMWFVGSAVMGVLYDRSVMAVVVFGLTMQLAAAAAFYWLRGRLRPAAGE
ncbi:MAG: major facilitator superfamily 1 [Bryobacterales bacterium]|nr:major facilitator superfamily 1 [Bryobacterales bacterium]